MRRTLQVLVLLVAAAIAVEPLVHTHPLTQRSSSNQCAVCVNAHARVTTLAPTPISPLVIVGEVAAVRLPAQAAALQTPPASRAPPAA
ncbi:MAG TPA: hypothetical protein VLV78_15105 [Thermoanaerobaculia bacterium]|nr:hypothetical protein [Thermoanaerobaculia bacterium]